MTGHIQIPAVCHWGSYKDLPISSPVRLQCLCSDLRPRCQLTSFPIQNSFPIQLSSYEDAFIAFAMLNLAFKFNYNINLFRKVLKEEKRKTGYSEWHASLLSCVPECAWLTSRHYVDFCCEVSFTHNCAEGDYGLGCAAAGVLGRFLVSVPDASMEVCKGEENKEGHCVWDPRTRMVGRLRPARGM